MTEPTLKYEPATIYDFICSLNDIEKAKEDFQVSLLRAFSNGVKVNKEVPHEYLYKARKVVEMIEEYNEEIRKNIEEREGN